MKETASVKTQKKEYEGAELEGAGGKPETQCKK